MTRQSDRPRPQFYHLHRDGERPVAFYGVFLATSVGQWYEGVAQHRWHDVTLYRTHDGQIVVHWEYHISQSSEAPHATVEVVATMEEAVMTLQVWDPTPWVALPQHTAVLHDTAAVVADVIARYDQQVAALVQHLGLPDTDAWAWSG